MVQLSNGEATNTRNSTHTTDHDIPACRPFHLAAPRTNYHRSSLLSLSLSRAKHATIHAALSTVCCFQPYRFPLHRRIYTGEGKSGRRIKVLISNCLVQFHTLLLHGPSSTTQSKGIPPMCCSYRCSWLYHCAHPHPFPNVTSHNALLLFASVCRLLAKVLHFFCFQCFARATLRW